MQAYLAAYFEFHPGHATGRGWPGFDARSPSFAPELIERYRGRIRALEETTRDPPATGEGSDEAIDHAQLRCELATAMFRFDVLRWQTRNPLMYVEAGIEAIEVLDFRQDLAERARFELERARIEGLTRLLAELETRITEPMQPYVESAMDMLEGGIDELRDRYVGNADCPELHEPVSRAMQAMDRAWNVLSRRASEAAPFQPMGEARFRELLSIEHLLETPLDELVALAERSVAEIEARLPQVVALEMELPLETPPSGFGRSDVLAYYQAEIDSVMGEVKKRELVTIPDGRLLLRETPVYLLPLLPGASYQPPAAFGRDRTGYFYVPPVPAELDDEDVKRYFRTVSHRTFRNLIVHEVCPGHHVQFLHAARHPSAIRKIRDNDVMIEGWALYCEQLMHDEGLFDEIPSTRPLRALRMRSLRVVVDIGIHTGRMTLEEAVVYMCRHLGEGASGWIEREVRRYAGEPTQAMSYLVGRQAVFDLREEWRDRVGPARYGLREFHDRFLAEGSIPIPLIRRKMLAAR